MTKYNFNKTYYIRFFNDLFKSERFNDILNNSSGRYKLIGTVGIAVSEGNIENVFMFRNEHGDTIDVLECDNVLVQFSPEWKLCNFLEYNCGFPDLSNDKSYVFIYPTITELD